MEVGGQDDEPAIFRNLRCGVGAGKRRAGAKSEGVGFLGKENTAAVFKVGSGSYDFTTSL